MTFKKGEKKPNQGNRGPGKATKDAREAIGAFVDGNAHRLAGWLDQVAEGIPKADADGYWVQPNPAKAFEMFQSVVEYHIPKLARTEHTGKDGGPIETKRSAADMSDAELATIAGRNANP